VVQDNLEKVEVPEVEQRNGVRGGWCKKGASDLGCSKEG
jgi:hypothetical protein